MPPFIAQLLWIVCICLIVGIALWGLRSLPDDWLDKNIKQFLRVAVIVVASIWIVVTVYAMVVGMPYFFPIPRRP